MVRNRFKQDTNEPRLVVDLVAEAGSVDDGQGDAGALLIKLEFWQGGNVSKTAMLHG